MSEPVDFTKRLKQAKSDIAARQLDSIYMPKWLQQIVQAMGAHLNDLNQAPAHNTPLDGMDIQYVGEDDIATYSFEVESLRVFAVSLSGRALASDIDCVTPASATCQQEVFDFLTGKNEEILASYCQQHNVNGESLPTLLVASTLLLSWLLLADYPKDPVVTDEGSIRHVHIGDCITLTFYPDTLRQSASVVHTERP